MSDFPDVTWTEAATVRPGQWQHTLTSPREITAVTDTGDADVIVSYADGTTRPYARHEDLPTLNSEDPR